MENDKITRREFLKYSLMGASLLVTPKILIDLAKDSDPEARLLNALNKSTIPLELKPFDYKPDSNKNALLIQQNNKFKDNVEIMNHLFKMYGYNCKTNEQETLATRKNIFGGLEEIAKKSNEKSKTIFYYAGHGIDGDGYDKGIKIDLNKKITPYEIFNSIGKIKGEKAIIIDTCLSGVFTDYLDYYFKNYLKNYLKNYPDDKPIIDNYVCITACPSKKNSIQSTYLIKNKNINGLTFGLYKLLNFAKENVDLITGKIEIANKTHRKYIKKLEEISKLENTSFDYQKKTNLKKFIL
jgi:hypothetical protein